MPPTDAEATRPDEAAPRSGAVFPYRHIACCVDGRTATAAVVEEATRLRTFGAERLTFLYAFEASPVPEAYPAEIPILDRVAGLRTRTAEWLESIAAAHDGHSEILEGYPPDAAVKWAAENDVDLIVAGSHRGAFQRMFLGGFAAYLAGHAPCSVLLVRPEASPPVSEAGAPYRHVAVCVEDSEPSRRALEEARVLRSLGPGVLSVVHVAQWPMAYLTGGFGMVIDPTDVFEREEAWLEAIVEEAGRETPVFLTGYPPAAVCDWAAQAHTDVLVAAAHRGLGERILLGSFAHYVAYHSPCSVLLTRMPAPGDVPEGE